jgi:murein DD-endopeptidase MepM/ murein hydrolase activator NlpD
VKVLAAGLAAVALSVTMLPAVLIGGDDPPTVNGCVGAVDGDVLDVILATIRTVESGGNYQTRITSASASGAYAFINASWRHYADLAGVDTTAYPSAWMAPPADQDATGAAYVDEILADHDGRIEIIPVAWYLPSAIDNPALMDKVPAVGANTLTPRQYQTKWMGQFRRQLQFAGLPDTTTVPAARAASTPTTPNSVAVPGGCTGGAVDPLPGGWSLPGLRAVLDANTAAMDDPHHDYPAWDWLIPLNTPIYAVHGGRVEIIHEWPHNWWTEGCGDNGRPGCVGCGVGLTIIDDRGYHWIYCHGTALTVHLDDPITAGQQILWSGNSGRSGAPHVHLEIRTDGTRRCPQPLIQSLYYHGVGLDPATLPTTGCSF